MQFKDYYEIMGVARTASQDEIKRAYRKLARKYHPDVSKEPQAETRFKEIGEAYEVLKDPEKRAAYDRLGQRWRSGEDFRPPPDWAQDFSFRGGGYTPHGDFSDFFEALFGAGFARGGARGGAHGGSRFHRDMSGQDQSVRVEIDLEQAYAGGEIQLEIASPRIEITGPGGRGAEARRRLKVRIPKGVTDGQRVRLRGQGGEGIGGAARGDLYLEFRLRPHPRFAVSGRDVTVTLPVAPWEAALGATVEVPTLGGPVELRVPRGSQAGRRLRLKGRGLPGDPSGDQLVTLEIVVPAPRDARDEAAWRQLAEQMAFDPRQADHRGTG